MTHTYSAQSPGGRRYDLDWLRVIAFACLIFYHVGMGYVTWEWHVKSVHASAFLEGAMMLMSPWRLALLFFISGVAFRFASDKMGQGRLIGRRMTRLGLPILFAMLVVVAPQSYFQLRQAGLIEPGYFQFLGIYLTPGEDFGLIMPTWNHLWYVVYLVAYSLIFAAVLPWLQRLAAGRGQVFFDWMAGGPIRLATLMIIPFLIYRFTLDTQFETTHNLVWDWANHAHRLTIFAIGYFVAKHDGFWKSVARAFPTVLALALTVALIMGPIWANFEAVVEVIPDWSLQIMRVIRIWFAWLVILAFLGAAQRYLNRPSHVLSYFNNAVFAWYLAHQTIIVAAIYLLTSKAIPGWAEFLLIALITAAGSHLFYEFGKRLPGPLPLFFGIEGRKSRTSALPQPA